jgi:integrase
VALLVGDYIKGQLEVNRAKDGATAARRALERMLAAEPELAATDANNVTRAQCFDVLDARKATPMATAKLRSMLGSAWEFALDAGRLDGNTPNWWRQLMQGKLKSKGKVMGGKHVGQSRRALRNEEIAALLGWLGNMHQIGRDAVVMYLWTCTRGSEIFAMRPEHVAKEGAVLWWTVPKELTKNARFAEAVDLRVPLFGQARQVVERRLASVARANQPPQQTSHSWLALWAPSTTAQHPLSPHAQAAWRKSHSPAYTSTGTSPRHHARSGACCPASPAAPQSLHCAARACSGLRAYPPSPFPCFSACPA